MTEDSFDGVVLIVGFGVAVESSLAVAFASAEGDGAPLGQAGAQIVAVIALVGDQLSR